jgi:long-subunit fatty acid transport protein
VLNFDLAASYKIDDQWTVGLGVQVQQGSGLISGASNGGAAVAGSAAEEFQAALQALGNGDSTNYNNLSGLAAAIKQSFEAQNPDFNDQSSVNTAAQTAIGTIVAQQDGAADVIAEYEGNNIAYGMVFGLTYDPMPELRLGLSYRSSVTHETEGDIVLRGDNATADAVIQGLGLTPGVDSGASLQITLPDSVILGASYMVLPELTLYGNLTYTRWSTVDNLNVKYDTADRNILVKLDFQNTLAISLGGEYSLNENLALRFGLASDPSPTTDDLRSPRSPDNDRTIISLGAGYGQDNWQIDAALAHYMFKEPKLTLKENAYPEADGRGNLEGEYSAAVNTFMLQFGYQI